MLGRVALATACLNGRRVGAVSHTEADGLLAPPRNWGRLDEAN